jgi:hypothetical protein
LVLGVWVIEWVMLVLSQLRGKSSLCWCLVLG